MSCLLVLAFGASAEAQSVPRKYAGIVVDAKSGKTLYESAADSLRYPASVTKVMTLYVLFEELEAGRLKLSTKMTVSRHAAAAVPTKLGLPAGAQVSVEDAIKSLVTLSANDMSRVIAEHISGSESRFAQRMTQTARALGMSRTTYRNASGLPDKGQVTTVRDQARLGIAIYQHFPKYYEFFQTRNFTYNGRTYGNHNRLLGNSGVDGIKTGYINASGYNLLTAARSGDRHIVAVGFGFNSGASRNSKVAELVKKYLPKGRSGSYVQTALIPRASTGGSTMVASARPVIPAARPSFRSAPAEEMAPPAIALASTVVPFPDPRPAALSASPAANAAQLVANNDNGPAPVPQRPSGDVIGAWISQTLRLDPTTGGLVPPAPIGPAPSRPIDLLTSGSVASAESGSGAGVDGWIIQIGAAPSEDGARSLIRGATASVTNLARYRTYVERTEKNGQVFYRARFSGFPGKGVAREMCEELKKEKMSCLALQG